MDPIINNSALTYLGKSFTEWSGKVDELEESISMDDGFTFSMASIKLDADFLRRLRCLAVAFFEASERPTKDFRTLVVLPLLKPEEQTNISDGETSLAFFQRFWPLSAGEVAAASNIFVGFHILMTKQKTLSVNARLHQAFDFVALFYNVYTVDWTDNLKLTTETSTVNFAGLFDRFHLEKNDWIKFLMGYVLFDFVADRMQLLDVYVKNEMEIVFTDYLKLCKLWTGIG